MVRAASLPSLPPGGFPAINDNGERICRQCGHRGRYKEGKCVEKWGPGPEGPGTVCDRCRKKRKRLERRGTQSPHSQTSASVRSRSHARIQMRDYAVSLPPLTVPPPLLVPQPPLGYGGPSEAREWDAFSPGIPSSVTVARPKGDAAHSGPSSRSHSRSPLSFSPYPCFDDEETRMRRLAGLDKNQAGLTKLTRRDH